MIPAIIFAQVWSVLELLVLTSLARTVRMRTVFAAMAAGFYLIGPLTAFIQLSWIHLAAPLFGKSPSVLQDIASYTADPFIEEAMKLVPLLALLLIPAIRRQWSISDFVLIAAATGSGFGLTEHLFRFAADAHRAQSVSGGWVIFVGASNALVPGFFRTMTSWLQNGVFYNEDPTSINWHLAWSALGGLAVGLIVRKRTRAAILSAVGILLFISVDHAYDNVLVREVQHSWLAWLAGPLHFLTVLLGVLVFAAIVVAWWLDEPLRHATMASGPLLAAEQSATTRVMGTFTAAASRLPWSIAWVADFDRQRRAFHAAHIAEVEGRELMLESLVAERDSVDAKLTHPHTPPLVPDWVHKTTVQRLFGKQLTRPSVMIWLLVTAPPVLFLIIGGWPATAWLQRVLTGPVIWQLVVLITIAGQARVAWGVYGGLRRLPSTARLPVGDDAAMLGLQLACGVGAVALGGFTLGRVLSGVGATDHLMSSHAADAANRLTPGGGTAVAGSANGLDTPVPPVYSPPESTSESPDANPAADPPASQPDHPENAASNRNPVAPAAAPPSPQELADQSAARAAQAKADADAAEQHKIDAQNTADSEWITLHTTHPDPVQGAISEDADAAAKEANASANAAQAAADAAAIAASNAKAAASAQAAVDAAADASDNGRTGDPLQPTSEPASAQELADQAAARADDARADADDAEQRKIDAQNTADSEWITLHTTHPDPVQNAISEDADAAAKEANAAAYEAREAADAAAIAAANARAAANAAAAQAAADAAENAANAAHANEANDPPPKKP